MPHNVAQFLSLRDAHYALDLDHTGIKARLRGLQMPIRVIWGDADPILPPDTLGRIREALPAHAEVVTLGGAGHGPMKDQPDAFAEAVLAFVRAHAA